MNSWKWAFAGILISVAAGVAVYYAQRPFRGQREATFRYEIDRFRVVDPDLILYREAEAIELGTRDLGGLAVDLEGKIYVAAESSLRIFDRNGRKLEEFGLSAPASCLAVATDETVFVGFKTHVEVFDRTGERRAIWTDLGEKAYLTSIAVHGADVYLADSGHRLVWRFDASGSLRGQIGKKDRSRNELGFIVPSPYFDVAVAPDGTLWVVNPGEQRVESFNHDGERTRFWGRSSMEIDGFCGCCNPSHIAIAPDGSFVTSEKGIPRVKLYDSNGGFLGVVTGPDQFKAGAEDLDLAVDTGGRIYVLDSGAASLRIFVRKGARGNR